MLLLACLSYALYTKILEDPFFFFGRRLPKLKASPHAEASKASIVEEMGHLYAEIAAINPRGYHD